jgi:hypothetical protein
MSEMTPEERAAELSGTRKWYDAVTTGTQREIDMLVATAIRDAVEAEREAILQEAISQKAQTETRLAPMQGRHFVYGQGRVTGFESMIKIIHARSSAAKETSDAV